MDIGVGWTDDRVEILKKLWSDGLSASAIARQLGGVTRNAVISKVHRLNLAGRPRGHVPSNATPMRVNRETAPRRTRPKPAAGVIALSAPGNLADIKPGEAAVRTWLSSSLPGKHQCKWPIGDPARPGFTFCDRVAIIDSEGSERPYCEHHCAMAYQEPKRRNSPKEFARGLRRYL